MSRYVDWQDQPVTILNLSLRGRRLLRRMGVTTIAELCARSASDVLVHCWSETTLREVQEQLAALGLRLRGD
jgi:DNA-directed RNA polymerase subunit alpha